jgi:hypothetical protein
MTIKLYNDTVEIEFQESVHRYKVDGSYTPGVSSVLAVLHKELMDWAAWMAAEDLKAAVMDFATSERSMTKAELKKLADSAKKAHRQKSQRGKDVGSIAHAWIEEETAFGRQVEIPQYSRDLMVGIERSEDIDVIDANTKAARHCVQQWRQWKLDYDIEVIKSEFIVHSRKLGYCGTADLLFKSKRTGKVYLGDYKTSEPQKIRNSKYVVVNHKPYPEHFVQIAAYDYAHNEETGIDPDAYAVIYLPKEGRYQMFTREEIAKDRLGWNDLFHVFQWITAIKRGK